MSRGRKLAQTRNSPADIPPLSSTKLLICTSRTLIKKMLENINAKLTMESATSPLNLFFSSQTVRASLHKYVLNMYLFLK